MSTENGKMSVLAAEDVNVCQFGELLHRQWRPFRRLDVEDWYGGIYILIVVKEDR